MNNQRKSKEKRVSTALEKFGFYYKDPEEQPNEPTFVDSDLVGHFNSALEEVRV